jgi:uncharacterized protein (TIGR03083 family)
MHHLLPDTVVVDSYRDLRSRVIELLRRTPEIRADRGVPHCPAWNVRDVVAHLVGVPEDILAGRMDGVTTDEWTQAQIDRHRAHSLADLVDLWSVSITTFDAVLPHIPSPVNSQFVMDAVTHEHDLRHALGEPGHRDSLAVKVAVGWLLDMAEERSPGAAGVLLGSGTSGFDILRVLSGRRSAAQISRLGLDGPGIVALLAGSPLRPPTDSIEE